MSLIVAGVMALAFVVWLAWPKPSTRQTPISVETLEPSVPVVKPPKPREPTVAEQLQTAHELTGAIGLLRHRFQDTVDELDPAAVLLAGWSSSKMRWADLTAFPEVKRAAVMKDSEEARGKRLCASGSISEIAVDRSLGTPIYLGGLVTSGYAVIRFAAVGSTGRLFENSYGRICGVVTGKQSFSNAGGGTTHAVFVVGMFDLPENKALK